MFERPGAKHDFTGGGTIVKDCVRQREPRGHEISVPLTHPPGPAQADFGEAVVVIGGVEQTAQFFVMDLLRHGFAAQRCLLCRAYSKAAMASVLRMTCDRAR